jgi:calcineurin-like phosphoesterase
MIHKLPERWIPATGDVQAQGVVFTLDDNDHRVTSVARISF